ncbi:hypothetical protein Golomagni_05718, partial [Golovinomyces magnicellulatus]
IPHHLLGTISLDATPWDVTEFKKKAQDVMQEIRSRGNLPILVGGTTYYVDALLFEGAILDEVQQDASLSFPILNEPTEVIFEELKRVDPVMAEKWHPKDRRKIQRSLEIFLQTGRPASALYAEQAEVKNSVQVLSENSNEPWENLLFWVFSERQVLCDRLDSRVNKMLDGGLLSEVRQINEFKRETTNSGQILDMTKGIWQSIGFKQFEPYCNADAEDPGLERLKQAALEDMKTATRRYANSQTKWIRLKQIPRLKEKGPEAVKSLYLMDSTDASRFQQDVVEPAAQVVSQFLKGDSMRDPTDMSKLASEMLPLVLDPPPKEIPRQRTCEVCQTTLVTDEAWNRHVKGAAHRRVLKKKKKLAVVPVDGDVKAEEEGNTSDLDISALER